MYIYLLAKYKTLIKYYYIILYIYIYIYIYIYAHIVILFCNNITEVSREIIHAYINLNSVKPI